MSKNNKKNWEHTVHKPFEVKGGKDTEVAVQCAECKKTVIFPNTPPDCDRCLERMDKCKHGVACMECSNKLMVEWIREGNMRVDDTPQLEVIQKMVKRRWGLEVFINDKGYLEIKE
jgi:hypothetical protein